jgi:type IV pilus assembly protein PilN
MIKINLLRNLGSGAVVGTSVQTDMPLSQEAQKQFAYRFGVICLAVGALILYEKIQLSVQQGEIDAVTTKINSVRAEKEKYGDAAPIVQKYNEQKVKLDAQIKILEGLTENRLREVKLLDTIQSVLPQKAWLDELSMDQGKVMMKGFVPDDQGVSSLYSALETNVLFSNVKVKSEAMDLPSIGSAHKFEFTYNAGKVK